MTTKEIKPDQSVQDFQGVSTFAAFIKRPLTRKMILERLYGATGSVIFHILVVIALLCLVLDSDQAEKLEEIKVTVVEPVPMQPIEEFTPPEPQHIPDDVEIPDVASPQDAIAMPTAVVAASESETTSSSVEDGMDVALTFKSDVSSPLVFQGLFAGRGKAGKAAGLALYAGGQGNLTEAAVLKALEWLKNHQRPDGSWHTARDHFNVAFTGLAVLTFLAHGETLSSERYGETLQKGLRWLIEIQKENGSFTQNSYAHGIATYAVSEGYALTQVPLLQEAMDKAVAFIIKGQQDNGGWTYEYARDGRRDTSVMGWQIQALKAASSAGCSIPDLKECLKKAVAAFKLQYYVLNKSGSRASPGKMQMGILTSAGAGLGKSQEEPMGMFTYAVVGNAKATGGASPTMTAVGTVCLEFLGEGTSPEAKGGRAYLRQSVCDWKNPPGTWAFYNWYYTTQAIFQGHGIPGNSTGKEDWKRWNNMFVKALVNNQNSDGSWRSPAPGEDGSWILDQTGSVYSTALGALTLMVYYRILPSYQQSQYSP